MGNYLPTPMIPNIDQLTAMDQRNLTTGYLCISIIEHRFELPNMTRPPIRVVISKNEANNEYNPYNPYNPYMANNQQHGTNYVATVQPTPQQQSYKIYSGVDSIDHYQPGVNSRFYSQCMAITEHQMMPSNSRTIHEYIRYTGFSTNIKPLIYKLSDFRKSMMSLNPVLQNIYNLETGKTHYKEFSKSDKQKLMEQIKKLDGWAGLNPATIEL